MTPEDSGIFLKVMLVLERPSETQFFTSNLFSNFPTSVLFQFRGPKLIFEAISKTNMAFKNILDHSAIIPAQFPYIRILYILNKIGPKSRNIDKNRYLYIKSLTSIPFGGPIV